MKRIPLLLALLAAASSTLSQAQKVNPSGFTYEEIHSGNGMTALDFDAAGRMFVCEKQGRVLVFIPNRKGGYEAPVVFADLRKDINPDNESGLLGIAIDPRFSTNRFLFPRMVTARTASPG